MAGGTCADEGWDYVFSFPPNNKFTPDWDQAAVRSHRNPGVAFKAAYQLCGYGFEPHFSGADNHIMLDIGANIGQTLFNYYSRGWRVVAFEPVPENVDTICRNIFINGVTSDRIALVGGAGSNFSRFVEIDTSRGWSDSTSISQKGVAGWKTKVDVHNVTTIAVDDYIDNAKSINFRNKIMFVKIDTQGHELSVLQGMKKFLSNPPTVEDLGGWSFIVKAEYSVKLQKDSGHRPNDMLDFMRGMGYEVRCIISED